MKPDQMLVLGVAVVALVLVLVRAWRDASESDRREAALRLVNEQIDLECGRYRTRPAPPQSPPQPIP